MRVQRVLMPDSETESWTLLGNELVPVEPVEQFLAYLTSIEKSPNTVKAYAHDLKDWFVYLTGHDLNWKTATLEDVAGFVAWKCFRAGGQERSPGRRRAGGGGDPFRPGCAGRSSQSCGGRGAARRFRRRRRATADACGRRRGTRSQRDG